MVMPKCPVERGTSSPALWDVRCHDPRRRTLERYPVHQTSNAARSPRSEKISTKNIRPTPTPGPPLSGAVPPLTFPAILGLDQAPQILLGFRTRSGAQTGSEARVRPLVQDRKPATAAGDPDRDGREAGTNSFGNPPKMRLNACKPIRERIWLTTQQRAQSSCRFDRFVKTRGKSECAFQSC